MNTYDTSVKRRVASSKLCKHMMGSVLALTLMMTPAWATFTARVNTDRVAVNDVFELTLTTDDNGQALPDLAPLEQDFQIISMSQSRLTHIVNGQSTLTFSWTITLSPKVVGQLNIPSLRLGNETTAPITLNSVRAGQVDAQNDESIKITAQVSEGNHYIFQEIPLTVRIETTQSISQAELIIGDVPNLDMRQQGEDRTTQVLRNGRPVTIMERQYIISPQATGKIEIPPITVRGNFLERRNSGGIDSLFDEQIREHLNQVGQTGQFGSLFSSVGAEFVAKSNPITLDIKANPNGSNDWFLPAKAVSLSGEWQPKNPTFTAGEAVTREVILLALGAQPEQLPTLDIPEVDGLQIYTDSDVTETVTTEQGIMAKRTVMLSIIPEHEGTFTLPEMRVDWQNTQNDTAQTAILPSEVFNVKASAPVTDGSEAQGLNGELSSSVQATDANSAIDNNETQINGILGSLSLWQMIGGLATMMLGSFLLWFGYRRLTHQKANNQIAKNQEMSSQESGNQQVAQSDTVLYSDHTGNTPIDTATNSMSHAKQKLSEAVDSRDIKQIYQALSTYKAIGEKALNPQDLQQTNQLLQQLEGTLFCTQPPPSIDNIASVVKNIVSSKSSVGKSTIQDSQVLPSLYPQ